MQSRSRNPVRDAEICRLYADENWTLEACGEKFGLSRQRIKQIIKAHDVWRRPVPRVASERNTEFLGVFMTEEDKAALRSEAERSGVSLSDLARKRLRGESLALPKASE